jgi:hypothetical protein
MSRRGPRWQAGEAYADYFGCAAKKVTHVGAHNLQACKDDATRRILLGIGLRFDPQEKEQPAKPRGAETFFNDKRSAPRKAKPVRNEYLPITVGEIKRVQRMMALAERRRA